MTDLFKAVAALATAIVAIIGLMSATGAFNPKPTATPPAFETPASTATVGPQSVPTQEPAGFRVIEAFLRADPFEGSAACPVVITFSGRISVVGGSGTVSYRFIRSDGASAPVQSLTFTGPGSQDVQETWTLGGSGSVVSQWEAIQILDPTPLESAHAAFEITCT